LRNDTLAGDGGNDVIAGGSGDDNEQGDNGDDQLAGGSGSDDLSGGWGSDDLSGGQGDDNEQGDEGNDTISDDQGSDVEDGGSGDDVVDGIDDQQYRSPPRAVRPGEEHLLAGPFRVSLRSCAPRANHERRTSAAPLSRALLGPCRGPVAVVTDVIEASNRSGLRGVVRATFDVAQGG
jgi:Ca2+-binding RTX toxin-like protein